MPKYNTMFDVAFTMEHDCEDPHDVDTNELCWALLKRAFYLLEHPGEAAEAFGVSDTYENE